MTMAPLGVRALPPRRATSTQATRAIASRVVKRHVRNVLTLVARQREFKRWTSRRFAFLSGLIVLGIGCYQLSLPNVLSGVLGWNLGYDDGVYLGVAVRFVNGVLPYRDFVFVQPPGIVYVMSPIALLGRVLGTHDALIVARCLTVFVVACNAVLAGLLMRHRGRIAVVVAGLACALWPLTVSVDRTLELEPYLIFFCLIGALLAFGSNESSSRRLVVAGIAFGFAGSVKVWAIFPIVAALLCLLPDWKKCKALFVGLVIGGVVPCLPFLLSAPNAFVRDVILAQLGRKAPWDAAASTLGQRMLYLSGILGIQPFHATVVLVSVMFAAFGVLIVFVVARHWRMFTQVEWFALAASVTTVGATFETSNLYDHYAYFPAVFLALLLGVCASRIGASFAVFLRRVHDGIRPPTRLATRLLAIVAFLGILSWTVAQEAAYGAAYLDEASNPAQAIDAVIPPGACAISDFPADLLVANRFTPNKPGCPAIVDPYGMNLVYNNGKPPQPIPPYPPKFVALWLGDLEAASYVDLRIPYSDFFPWSTSAMSWFSGNYFQVAEISFSFPKGMFDTIKVSYIYTNVRKLSLRTSTTNG